MCDRNRLIIPCSCDRWGWTHWSHMQREFHRYVAPALWCSCNTHPVKDKTLAFTNTIYNSWITHTHTQIDSSWSLQQASLLTPFFLHFHTQITIIPMLSSRIWLTHCNSVFNHQWYYKTCVCLHIFTYTATCGEPLSLIFRPFTDHLMHTGHKTGKCLLDLANSKLIDWLYKYEG